jgi:hypothetical protein
MAAKDQTGDGTDQVDPQAAFAKVHKLLLLHVILLTDRARPGVQ